MSILKQLVETEHYFELTRLTDTIDEDVLKHSLKERRLILTFHGNTVHNIMKDVITKAGAQTATIKRAVFTPDPPALYFAVDLDQKKLYFEVQKDSKPFVPVPGSKRMSTCVVNELKQIPSSSKEVDLGQILLPFNA